MLQTNPSARGYLVLYHEGERTRCPGCGHSNWHIGRSTAECAFCATALPVAQESVREALPTLFQSRECGLHDNVEHTPLLLQTVLGALVAGSLALSAVAYRTFEGEALAPGAASQTAQLAMK